MRRPVAEGHRALVFSQFTEMLRAAQAAGRRGSGITYLYLDGRTKDRMAKVDQFNAPDGPPLFFISLKAGGTGLNLTAADYVIHYDPWWNPAVEDQATDRTHRIGQTRAVISYKLITRGHGGGEDPRPAAAQAGAGRRACSAPTRTSARRSPNRTSKTCSRRSSPASSGRPGPAARGAGPCALSHLNLNACAVSAAQGTRSGREGRRARAARRFRISNLTVIEEVEVASEPG